MKHALMATVAFLGIVMLGAAGCSTKAHVQTGSVVVGEMASFEQEELEPCTTLEGSLLRAGQLTNSSFSGATQYDGAIRFEFDSSALSADAKTAIDSVVVPLVQTNTVSCKDTRMSSGRKLTTFNSVSPEPGRSWATSTKSMTYPYDA